MLSTVMNMAVLVLNVVVIMPGVRVGMGRLAVAVFVSMRIVMGVLFGHRVFSFMFGTSTVGSAVIPALLR